MLRREEVQKYTDDELDQLALILRREIVERERKLASAKHRMKFERKVHRFEFDLTSNHANKDYLAKLYYDDKNSKVERDFVSTFREGDKKFGVLSAYDGDVIESRKNGKMKLELVNEGKLQKIPMEFKQQTFSYIAGMLTSEELLEKIGGEAGVLDELRDED